MRTRWLGVMTRLGYAASFTSVLDGAVPVAIAATVADDGASIHPAPRTIAPVVGAPFANLVVAAFTDSNRLATAADFTSSVDWGDGTHSSGTVQATQGGFQVLGGHTYSRVGAFPVTVTIRHSDNTGAPTRASATGASEAHVADAVLSGAGAIHATPSGFLITATHTFAAAGQMPVSVLVADSQGSTTTIRAAAAVRNDCDRSRRRDPLPARRRGAQHLRCPTRTVPVRRRRRSDRRRRTPRALRGEHQRRRTEGATHCHEHRDRRDAADVRCSSVRPVLRTRTVGALVKGTVTDSTSRAGKPGSGGAGAASR